MTRAIDDSAREIYQERAAIMEHDGGLPRDEAEAKAKQIAVKWWKREKRKESKR